MFSRTFKWCYENPLFFPQFMTLRKPNTRHTLKWLTVAYYVAANTDRFANNICGMFLGQHWSHLVCHTRSPSPSCGPPRAVTCQVEGGEKLSGWVWGMWGVNPCWKGGFVVTRVNRGEWQAGEGEEFTLWTEEEATGERACYYRVRGGERNCNWCACCHASVVMLVSLEPYFEVFR